MSDKGIVLKVDECKILKTMDDMCAESLDPETHDAWETVRFILITTRKQLTPLCPTAGEIANGAYRKDRPQKMATK